MGNCVSFQVSCDLTLISIIRYVCGKCYIRKLKENLRSLKREMEDLKASQHEVQNKVTREEETGHRQRLEAVQVWLTRVDRVDAEFNDLFSTTPVQLKKLCLCGLCSKDVYSSYKYGRWVYLLLEEVKKLKLEGNFVLVAEPAPASKVEERPTRPTIGHEIMLETAWNRLMEDEVGIMGLHGMGGVGKTTLFKKIHNKFAKMATRFDVVIWIVVSQGAKISKLQDDIAEKLHLSNEVWRNKSEGDKSTDIHRVLKGKRFVLMLDDIWEKVDLEAIGIPFPTRENGCKVAFTTRSLEVCGRMEAHETMQVNCLKPEEAWELFKKKVGENTLRRDPVIVDLARRVAGKCCGLPLALNVIGETMASKTTIQEWEHAIDVLVSSAAEFSDMENKILPILKYSYDSLGDEHIKSSFLYCALFPEDFKIEKDELIEYWICEGFIGEYQVIYKAMNKGYEILGTLIRANLLMAVSTTSVVMHDVVREMALWIASNFGKQKENFVVQARVGLCEIPKVKDWGSLRRMSLMKNKIEEITCGSKCIELTTLLLQGNKLKSLSGEFIHSMKKLIVLDLSLNRDFNELPEQISELVSLQFLDLSCTSIEQLPVGFQELKRLSHLDLSYTSRLCSLGGISKLSSLRTLKLLASNVHGEVNSLKEMQLLEHLQVLTITISTELGLEQLLYDQRLTNCISCLQIRGLQQKPFNISLLLMGMKNLRALRVESSHVSELMTNIRSTESTSPCFSNLSIVVLITCSGIKHLTWLLFAPNLVYLHIDNLKELEEIINKEKETNLTGITTPPFQNLQFLGLDSLPTLESIYWSPLRFPVLVDLRANDCPNLRKFPLNASSAPQILRLQLKVSQFEREVEDTTDESYKAYASIPDIEWEDEDTKNRFWLIILSAANIQS